MIIYHSLGHDDTIKIFFLYPDKHMNFENSVCRVTIYNSILFKIDTRQNICTNWTQTKHYQLETVKRLIDGQILSGYKHMDFTQPKHCANPLCRTSRLCGSKRHKKSVYCINIIRTYMKSIIRL